MTFCLKSFFKIALRNIGRHKVKTFLTIFSIFLGLSLYIFMDGWLLGIEIDSMRNLVNYEIGSAKIYSKEYFKKKDEIPSHEVFNNYKEIVSALNKSGYSAAPRFAFKGLLIGREKDATFLFYGIEPSLENEVFRYNKFIESGEFVKDNEFKIMIGTNGAEKLKLKVGDGVRLYTTIDKKSSNGKITHTHQLIDLSVGGIINSPDPKINGNVGFLPLSILQDESGLMLGGGITEISIRKSSAKDYEMPGDFESPDVIKKTLGKELNDNLTLVGWEEDAKDFLTIAQTKRGGTGFILILLLLITVLLISNTMLLAVIERTKELGMMRSLGMSDLDIVILLLIEGCIIGVIGSFCGAIGGIVADYYMVNYGLDFTTILKGMEMEDIGYRVVGIFKSAWNIESIVKSFFLGIIVSMLATLSPALNSIKLKITDALRFE